MSKGNPNNLVVSRKRQREAIHETTENAPDPPKIKRQFTEKDQKFADIYENLADQSQKLRLEAAKQLLQEFAVENDPSAEDIEKALTRLFRGLSSGRKAARYGFFVALTELLRQVYGKSNKYEIQGLVSLDDIVKLMVQLTKAGGQAVGQEKRDHQFGRMYGSKAIIQSSVLFQDANALDTWNKILDIVFELAVSVPWLREECGMVVIDAIKSLSEVKHSKKYVKACIERLQSNKLTKTPEGVAIWITAQTVVPKFTGYPSNCWINDDPLDVNNRADLRRAMRDQNSGKQSGEGDEKGLKAGVWQQTVHFAWETLLERATVLSKPDQKPQSENDEPNKFKSIWKGLVDDGLFLESSSIERKFWGFQLFSKLLRSAQSWAVPYLFQPNLVQNLINSQSNESKFLHEAATDSLKKVKTRVLADPDLAHRIVAGLISKNGSAFFDQMTKSKTTESVMIAASPKSFIKIVELFEDFISNQTGKDEQEAAKGRQALGDLLLHAFQGRVKAGLASGDSDKWTQKLLTLLVQIAYCKPKKDAKDVKSEQPPFTESTRRMFQTRLMSCLAFILPLSIANPAHWPWHALHSLHSATKSSSQYKLILETDKEISKRLKKSYNITKDMHGRLSDINSDSATEQVVLLYSMSLLEAYSGDADAIAILGELNESFDTEGSGADDAKYDQILEVLLSFMSKPSSLFRSMAISIFTATSSRITSEGLESLSAILRQPETLSGQQELFAEDNGAEDSESDSDDDDELDSDVEMIDGAHANVESDDSSSGSDSDDSEEIDIEVQDFELKLAQALKTSQPGQASEEMTDDESMDDDEMLAIEPKLAAVFRERRIKASKQKEKKDAKENVVLFKKRVLDLLNIYVKAEYTNPLVLEILLPLIELIRISPDISLQQKAKDVIDNLQTISTKNKQQPSISDADFAFTLLSAIHAEALTKVHDKKQKIHSAACSKASLYVVRALVIGDKELYGKVVDVYAETQRQWFGDKKGAVQATFFTEWISWSINARKTV